MGDVIEVRGLRVMGICGVLPEERARAQPLEVDLDITMDLSGAGSTDDLGATADYGSIVDVVSQIAVTLQPFLLERLATRIAECVLDDGRVEEVTVAVRKLRPPVPHDVSSTGVRLTRARS